ncbi:acyltransferase family protein [Leclercia sp.]|uniref:acyltransferase family protein n=1 Tax=Leclercia sp. TaxID=1898428 RepID=UPI002FDED947
MGWIRLFLAASVVVAHNGIRVPGVEGHLAVLAFFVISGFYMGLVLNERYVGNTLGFYVARFLRLWPSYIIVFLAVLMFVSPMDHIIYTNYTAAILVWLSSLTMLFYQTLSWFGLEQSGDLVFLNINHLNDGVSALINATHMQQMWSVGVELCFYIVAPMFARKPKAIMFLLLIALGVFIYIKNALFFHHPLDHRSAVSSFWLFLLGMLSYYLWRRIKENKRFDGLSPITMSFFGVAVSIVCIAVAWQFFNNPYAIILCYSFFAVSIAFVFNATKKSKVDRWIGELSYPIYLIHWPIVSILITGHRGSWVWSFIIIGLSMIASVLLNFVIDRSVEQYRRTIAS